MIELTFLGITVLAPASEKAPWIPCRERDGYLAVSSSYFSQERRNLFKTSTLIMYLDLPFPLVFSLLPLYLSLSYITPRIPLTLPSLLSPLFSRLYSSPFLLVYLRSSQPLPFLLLSSGCYFSLLLLFFCIFVVNSDLQRAIKVFFLSPFVRRAPGAPRSVLRDNCNT